MENLDQKFDLKASRNKFICKKCDRFPRPGVKLMRCASCKQLLCQNCCGEKCPLCQFVSKNKKVSTFIEESELSDILAGFKTHPCVNVKNGCLEEILANLDKLKDHDDNCIFQMVPCPKMDCTKTFIFKDLNQHLKEAHSNDVISIFYGTEKNEYTFAPGIFGIYKIQAELVNGRNYYQKQNKILSIWFHQSNQKWRIGLSRQKGERGCSFAYVKSDIPFPDSTSNWKWKWAVDKDLTKVKAERGLGVKVLSFNPTKEWNFEGSKEELLSSFCCLNAYDRQFYPQFKEVNNCLAIRTLMLGFQEETVPFEYSITFFRENDKPYPSIGDIVYPIAEDKTLFPGKSIQYPIEKLTEYYDTETKEFKNQSKIIFTMKIINLKLDEVAKDKNMNNMMKEENEKDSFDKENKKNGEDESAAKKRKII